MTATHTDEPALEAPWTVLADPAGTGPVGAPTSVRRMVAPIAVAAVTVVAVVALAGSLVGRHLAEEQAVHDVAQLTDVLADSVVAPALTDAMITDPALARRTLDPIVRTRVLGSDVVRTKLWTPGGTVLYSDEPRLIGATFALEDEARTALTAHRTEAGISDLSRPENGYERARGRLLEVYRPVWTPSGRPLLFEAYFRYDAVSERSSQLWHGFGGVLLSSVLALALLSVPLTWALARRSRRARQHREVLMRRALDASDDERRRIAATLHDGVVQQLAAASFIAAAAAERANREQPGLGGELHGVADTVRDGIAGLRSLLVDIYPASLRDSGLAAALRDVARTSGSADVTAEVDDVAADALPVETQQAVFRVAQEAVRNAQRHAGAAHVHLMLTPGADGIRLDVADDGRGFDLAARGPQGHFGLALMTDQARRAGARLAVASAPGRGTTVRLEVPAT